MKLLVTGGSGFIGSNFIRYWLARHSSDSIVNLDALTYAGNPNNLKDIEPDSRYTFIHGDVCDAETVKRAFDEVDTVVHFAAESHVDNSIVGSLPFMRTNVLGTHTLLEEMKSRGDQVQRFHHISTDEVFGSLDLDAIEKFNEKTAYDPRSPYSASKAASDHICRAYFHTHGLPITISNCSNNYGPYQHEEKFIPVMIAKAIADTSLPVYGEGKNIRDWLHVEDHCRGIEVVLLKGKIGETYCFGGDTEVANIDMAKKILHILDKPESLISFVEDRKGHDLRYAIDASKAKRELGWEPLKVFDEGLKKTIEWYRGMG